MRLSSNKDKRTVSTCRNCIGSFCPRQNRLFARTYVDSPDGYFRSLNLEKGSSVNTGTVHVKSYSFCRASYFIGRVDLSSGETSSGDSTFGRNDPNSRAMRGWCGCLSFMCKVPLKQERWCIVCLLLSFYANLWVPCVNYCLTPKNDQESQGSMLKVDFGSQLMCIYHVAELASKQIRVNSVK